MIKTAGGGNLCDAEGGITQKIAADLHTIIIEKGDRRLRQVLLKDLAALAAADHARRGDILQSDVLLIMLVNIGYHLLLYLDIRILLIGGYIVFDITVLIENAPHFIKVSQKLKLVAAFVLLPAKTDILKKLCKHSAGRRVVFYDHDIRGII